MFENIVESKELRELVDQVNYRERWKAADILAGQINSNLADLNICSYDDNFAGNENVSGESNELIANGIVQLGTLLDDQKIGQIISYFENCCCYNAHIHRYSDKQCYDLETVSKHPFSS